MIPLHDVLMLGLGAILTLVVSFAVSLWLLNDTVIPTPRRGDKPGD